jgi:hypothetical protein
MELRDGVGNGEFAKFESEEDAEDEGVEVLVWRGQALYS